MNNLKKIRAALTLGSMALLIPYERQESPNGKLMDRNGIITGEIVNGDVYRIDSNSITGLRYDRSIN